MAGSHPHISPHFLAWPTRHVCTRHGPQRHSAPGTAPLGCSVAVACTLFLETPRAAAAPRHSAAALPPGFPCLVLASRRSIWQGTHPLPRTRLAGGASISFRAPLPGLPTMVEARIRLEQARAAPQPAAPPHAPEPRSARLMSAASMACKRPPVGTASCTSATAHRAGFRRPREGFIRSLRGVHRSRHHTTHPAPLPPPQTRTPLVRTSART